MEYKNFKETIRKNALKREVNEAVAREYLKTTRPDLYREGMTIHNGDPASPLCTAVLDVKTKLVIIPDEGVYEKPTGYGASCKMFPDATHIETDSAIYMIVRVWADGMEAMKFDKLLGSADVSFKIQRDTYSHPSDGRRYFLDNRQRIYFA